MRRRFLIVFNPTAGVPRYRFLAKVVDGLASRGAVATVVEHVDPEAAAAAVRAAAASHDVVVAAGGDGTVRQVAGIIGDFEIPMGVIPLGTGNVLAREIGLQLTPPAVVDTLLDGPVAIIHGARANGAAFFLMAGIGFDGRTVAALDQRLKRRLGRAAYAHAVVQAWRPPVDELEIEIDGRPYAANWLIVTNARHYGGSFQLTPRGSIFTPGLEAIVIRAPSRRALFAQMLRLAQGRLTAADNRRVTAIPARSVRVTAPKAVPVQLDGDRFGATPLTIDADGPQLRLIVPR